MSKIRISCETEGAEIYYTLDGSTPDNSKNLYESEFEVNEACDIKAIAEKEGYDNSELGENSLYSVSFSNILGRHSIKVYDGNNSPSENNYTPLYEITDDSKILLFEKNKYLCFEYSPTSHTTDIYSVIIKNEEGEELTPDKQEKEDSTTAITLSYYTLDQNIIVEGIREIGGIS